MMVKRSFSVGMVLLMVGASSWAQAAVGVAPPAMYPADLWQGRTQAVIRVLNRLDAHIETLTVPVGGTATYGTLSVAVEACVSRPETLPADAGVLLHLRDTGDSARAPFDGWMLQNEPSVATYGSPLYDVRVVSCAGDKVAPDAGPLPAIKTPQLTDTNAPEEEGGDDQSHSSPSSEGGPVPLAPDTHSPIPLAPPSGGAQSLVPSAPQAPPSGQPLPPPEADPGLE
ncbi:DUF2155 domain-containing protein [Gluconobacter japonicus]|uniref:DUF2155 domain-containing protein n=1 Tax=Gluconobacter japonicus TaxID=376620 RepID=A0ABQ5WFE2_GLUJA|nr:DUF2155 domain-containing protein [Gluconobacter japonicus]GLQ58821.1 hypothetical protein GCM10010937_06240 [Gluconobacter japonicus]